MPKEPVVTTGPGKFRSQTEVLCHFAKPEELLHTINAEDGRRRVNAACALGRTVAGRCRSESVSRLAASFRVKVTLDSWTTCRSGVLYLAESDLGGRTITVNRGPLQQVASFLRGFTGLGSWRTEERIQEVVLGHEMYHMVTGRRSLRETEIEAHAFARSLLGLPFSPTLFEWAACRIRNGASGCGLVPTGPTAKD